MEDLEEKQTLMARIKRFITECVRVVRVTKKPSALEFKTIVKVSGLGIIIIGAIGFLVTMIKQLIL